MIRPNAFRASSVIVIFLSLCAVHAYADLVIHSGETLTLNSSNSEILIIAGDLIIEDGATLQGASNTEIRISGSWDNSLGGSFIHAGAKVFFTGTAVSVIKGNNNFYQLVVNKKDATTGQEFTGSEIQVESGTTQTISSQLILNGAALDDRLTIRSTVNGNSHTINASTAAYVEAWFLDIDDSIFLGTIDMPMNIDGSSIAGPIVGSGNNDGWIPNVAPTISIAVNNFIEDFTSLVAGLTPAGSYQINDVNNDELIVTFTAGSNLNGHYTLDVLQKKIYLTQVAINRINKGNTLDQINLSVSDGIETVSDTETPTITAVNDLPSFNSTPLTTATEDQEYSYVALATDEDVDASLSFSVIQKPSWLDLIEATGELKGTPTNADVGDHDVVISVSDGVENVSQTFTVTVANTNDGPSFNSTPLTTATEDQEYSYVALATDEDVDASLSFSVIQKPSWLDLIEATGELKGTPTNADVGDHDVVISVSDGVENVSQTFTVTVVNTNDIPFISGTAAQEVFQDQWYRFIPSASDIDKNDRLTFEIVNKPLWATFDVSNGELKGMPDNSHVGITSNITISVTDDIIEAPVSLATFFIEVLNVNDSPVIDFIAEQYAHENQLFEFVVTASDKDKENSLSFSLAEREEGMTIDPISGLISWTPGDSITSGHVPVTIEVDDGSGADNAKVVQTFSIYVTAVNDLPIGVVTINGIVVLGGVLTATSFLSDADGMGEINYQWQADGVDIEGETQNTYQITSMYINKSISVVARYTDAQGTAESVASNTSTQILNLALNQLVIDSTNNTKALYVSAGISNITDENISSINDAISRVGVRTQLQVQQLVNGYNYILDYAANNLPGARPPTFEDYNNIGITKLTQNGTVLSLLNDVVDLANGSDVETVQQLQTFVDAVLALNDQVEHTSNVLSKTHLEILGIEAVTDNNITAVRQIIANTSEQLDQLEKVQLLVNQIVASQIIQAYSAASHNYPAPTLSDFATLGLDNVTTDNIQQINIAIAGLEASAIDSIDKLVEVLTTDSDSDGVEDLIDAFPFNRVETVDSDGDGVGNNSDNCPNIVNSDQINFDSDSHGDVCDTDEDNDGVVSAEDAFRFNPNYSSDADSDGMPDAFEREYGFDSNNSADKNSDSDGDGVTNIDEFIAGTNPRVNPNPGLPQLVIPEDIEVVSTGRMTAVDIGIANAIDGSQTVLQPVASSTGPFSAGRHEIAWTATDSSGNQSKAVQVVKILPLVNLTPSSLIAEGGTVEIRAVLSGDAADYPVQIPYTLSGSAANDTDYSADDSTGFLTINQGREASFSIDIETDEELENDETIEIKLNQPTHAVLGSVTERTVTIIDGNLPPQISVVVEQGSNLGRVIAADKGEITVTASVSDPNPEDSHTFDWKIESEQTSAVVSNKIEDNKKVLILDPSQLEPGIFSITVKAVDSAEVVATTEVKTDFRLMQAAPVLSVDIDSDGDGTNDAEEGYDDSDNDGIVDYMDNLVEPNLAPVGADSTVVLQAAVGTKVILGETAFANAESTVMVTKQQMINVITERNQNPSLALLDKEYTYPYGLYDFVVSGEIPGNSYYLVLPLEAPFVEGQVFRKYMGPQIGWQNFIENANNSIFSAAAIGGACPEPGSRLFVSGIQAGHSCIQLYIEDGGPNDIDALANGIVTDPGGVATFTQQGFAPSAENSKLELDKVILTTNNDKTILTITVADENGSYLEGVTIVASCKQCIGVKIGDFNYQGQGIYKADINSSAWLSNGLIEAIVSNEFGSASLTPKRLVVKFKSTGGCTVVSGQPTDISLFLFLFIFTLLNFVRRRNY